MQIAKIWFKILVHFQTIHSQLRLTCFNKHYLFFLFNNGRAQLSCMSGKEENLTYYCDQKFSLKHSITCFSVFRIRFILFVYTEETNVYSYEYNKFHHFVAFLVSNDSFRNSVMSSVIRKFLTVYRYEYSIGFRSSRWPMIVEFCDFIQQNRILWTFFIECIINNKISTFLTIFSNTDELESPTMPWTKNQLCSFPTKNILYFR